jgi:hypothetical protein
MIKRWIKSQRRHTLKYDMKVVLDGHEMMLSLLVALAYYC